MKDIQISDIKVLYSEEVLAKRVAELGAQISRDYEGKDLVLICLLKGGVAFMMDLSRQISVPLAMDFMTIKSYTDGGHYSGYLQIVNDLGNSIEGKDVLIVEDIVDSGRTIDKVKNMLSLRKPASLKVCVMLNKLVAREVDVPIDYYAFTVENQFIVGCGLDYNQLYRNLPYIGYVDLEDE